MPSNDRTYLIGSTVHLRVRTTHPETRAPLDPPTPPVLDDLNLGTNPVPLPTDVTFTRITPGEYRLSLQTGSLAPGVYTWRAKAVDANGGIALNEDTFVLRATT